MEPLRTNIYHITHIDNLVSILEHECLWSDNDRIALALESTNIGYSHIKRRRRNRPVDKAALGVLADYVPFNFCPRSVMLYAIARGKLKETGDYHGDQTRILHLVSSVETASKLKQPWTFTNIHAELAYASYYDNQDDLDNLDWDIIRSDTWGGEERRHIKQAEFLVHRSYPWTCIETIAVYNETIKAEVEQLLENADHKPKIIVRPDWYY